MATNLVDWLDADGDVELGTEPQLPIEPQGSLAPPRDAS
jgi:hypothetical protein